MSFWRSLTRGQRRFFVTVATLSTGGFAIYRTLHPTSRQEALDLEYHPIASLVGAIVPAMIAGLVAYAILARLGRPDRE